MLITKLASGTAAQLPLFDLPSVRHRTSITLSRRSTMCRPSDAKAGDGNVIVSVQSPSMLVSIPSHVLLNIPHCTNLRAPELLQRFVLRIDRVASELCAYASCLILSTAGQRIECL